MEGKSFLLLIEYHLCNTSNAQSMNIFGFFDWKAYIDNSFFQNYRKKGSGNCPYILYIYIYNFPQGNLFQGAPRRPSPQKYIRTHTQIVHFLRHKGP